MIRFKFKVGDSVWVQGANYQSANGTLLYQPIEKTAGVVKKIAERGSHPYAIEGIHGWFNENSLSEYIIPQVELNDKVQLIKNENYRHKPTKLSPSIVYEITKIEGDKAYINYKNVTIIANIYNLKKV